MCRLASFKYRPDTQEIAVFAITSHGETEKELNLNVKLWHDGHYLPDGSIECRLPEHNRDASMEAYIKDRWPTFVEFYLWALEQHGQDKHYKGDLDLSSLTTIPDWFTLPASIGGWLFLSEALRKKFNR